MDSKAVDQNVDVKKEKAFDVDLNLRFYENRYPETDELVMFRVTRIEDMGAYGELLEYANVEGMLLLSELSKRRFRSIAKLIKVGRVEVCMVIRVDENKGYIDLSKKRVSKEDIPVCESRYSRAKKVQLTNRYVSNLYGLDPQFLNEHVMWPLDRKYGNSLDGLMQCLNDDKTVFDFVDRTKVSDEILGSIVSDIKSRMAPSNSKTRCIFEVTCNGREGVNAVKESIAKGIEASNKLFKPLTATDESDLLVRLIAPPRFIATCTDPDVESALARLKKLLEESEKSIIQRPGGAFQVFEEVAIQGDEEQDAIQDEEYSYESDKSDLEGMGDVQA